MNLSERIVSAVLYELNSRRGFDDLFDSFDEDIQREILDTLTTLVDEELDR
jgi:hypothetical protein